MATEEECPSSYFEGLSSSVNVTPNDDGTFTFTIVQTSGGGTEIEFKFTTIPFFTFNLGTFETLEGAKQRAEWGPLKELPFELKLAGYMKPSADNLYYSWRVVRSPYDERKDEGKQS